jgi:hypothetical protein
MIYGAVDWMYLAKSRACCSVFVSEQNFLTQAPSYLTSALADVCVNAVATAVQ